MVKFPFLRCLRCNHSWIKRVEKPVLCPKCKSPKWNEPRKERGNDHKKEK